MPRGIPNKRLTDTGEPLDDTAFDAGHDDDTVIDDDILIEAPAAVPVTATSAELARIKELENLLALERGKKDTEPEFEEKLFANEGDNIVIHIVGEGFTALGQQWYVGQELEFIPAGQAYKDTVDRHGRSWLALAGDEMAQVEKYGSVMFRPGRWPGKDYTAAEGSRFQHPLRPLKEGGGVIMPPTADELLAASRRETQRGRRVPILPQK